jgi:hypothetical protein
MMMVCSTLLLRVQGLFTDRERPFGKGLGKLAPIKC